MQEPPQPQRLFLKVTLNPTTGCGTSPETALSTLNFSKYPPHPNLELSLYFFVLFLLKKKDIIKVLLHLGQGRHSEDIQFLWWLTLNSLKGQFNRWSPFHETSPYDCSEPFPFLWPQPSAGIFTALQDTVIRITWIPWQEDCLCF